MGREHGDMEAGVSVGFGDTLQCGGGAQGGRGWGRAPGRGLGFWSKARGSGLVPGWDIECRVRVKGS